MMSPAEEAELQASQRWHLKLAVNDRGALHNHQETRINKTINPPPQLYSNNEKREMDRI